MVRSMTGYGRAIELRNGKEITVEVKSINHRYLDFSCRTPRMYGYLEEKLKGLVQQTISRGKVDVFVSINCVEESEDEVRLNAQLAESYLRALRELGERFSLQDDVTVSTLARYNEIFTVRQLPEDEQRVWEDVRAVAQQALDHFVAMREAEGQKLKEDVLHRCGSILQAVETIEARSPALVEAYRARLTERIRQVVEDRNIDEARVLTEAAIFADKIAVDEETVRLRSHIAQVGAMLEGDAAVGRKLDFLLQEMNREINTIGSKNADLAITGTVVEVKAELEKIREQIQNIE